MQTFERGENESLIIDGHIEVRILEVLEDSVRVAIVTTDEPSYREETIALQTAEHVNARELVLR